MILEYMTIYFCRIYLLYSYHIYFYHIIHLLEKRSNLKITFLKETTVLIGIRMRTNIIQNVRFNVYKFI